MSQPAPLPDDLSFNPRVGWRVVIVSSLAMFIVFGIRQSFSVFFAEFSSAEGWSSAASSSIFSISMISFALGSVPAGLLLVRYDPRKVFAIGALILGLGLLISSRATDILHIQIGFGLVSGVGLGIVGLAPVGVVIASWFPDRRGLAIGITYAGTGFGALIFVPFCEYLIDRYDWRTAYLVLAIICFFVLVPLMGFGQSRPPRSRRQSIQFNPGISRLDKVRELTRMSAFWWLMILAFLTVAPIRILSVHQIAYLEEIGIERDTAAFYVGLGGLFTALTFIVWGYASDRFGRALAVVSGALCMIGSVVILFILGNWESALLLGLYSLVVGLAEGSRSGQTTAIAGDIFHGDYLGAIGGIVGAMYGFGAAAAPWIAGYLRDHTGNYEDSFYFLIVITILSIFAFVMVIRSSPHEVEEIPETEVLYQSN